MTLTTDQARKIAEIAGWTDYGEYNKSYSGKMPDGMYWHMICDGRVTWNGLGDLLRVCKERTWGYRALGNIMYVSSKETGFVIGCKRAELINDIPTALALAMLEALEDFHADR